MLPSSSFEKHFGKVWVGSFWYSALGNPIRRKEPFWLLAWPWPEHYQWSLNINYVKFFPNSTRWWLSIPVLRVSLRLLTTLGYIGWRMLGDDERPLTAGHGWQNTPATTGLKFNSKFIAFGFSIDRLTYLRPIALSKQLLLFRLIS